MLYVLIAILIALVLFLSIRLILLKKEMRHISKEMKENEDRRQLNINLVDGDLQKMIIEVNSLYENILQIKAETMKEEDRLKESVSMISHDMRTPLTSIIGYLQVAERSGDPAEKDQNISIALERAKYLNKMVNDFFELSLIESELVTTNMERVNLSEVICDEILAESPEIDRKGIEPEFKQADENIFIMADKKMLRRVIQNLTSNAIKYSKGKLEYRIETVGKSEDSATEKVKLYIISNTDREIDTSKIFERFYKEESSRTEGGAGLGLYIVKSFVEAMGGSISASCADGLFEVCLNI